MNDVYQRTLMLIVEYGVKFSIDIKERSMKVNNKMIVQNGVLLNKDDTWGVEPEECIEDCISKLVVRFNRFYHSRCDAATEHRKYRWFAPLPFDKLSNDDHLYGDDRRIAQFELEYYLLCQMVFGTISAETLNMGDKFYWKPTKRSHLVIYRDWFRK